MEEKRKFTDLEYEVLISEVESRTCLWNERHKDFKNSVITRKLWAEVGQQLNLSGEDCKRKWKNLKDTFRKRISVPLTKSTAPSPYKKWKFEDLMEFTRDLIVPSPMEGGLQSFSVAEENASTDVDIQDPDPTEQQDEIEDRFSRPHRSCKKIAKKDDIEKKLLDLEERKLNAILNSGRQNDSYKGDDLKFFESLLPYVSKLNDIRKLAVRTEILNIIIAALGEQEVQNAQHQYNPNCQIDTSVSANCSDTNHAEYEHCVSQVFPKEEPPFN